MGPELRGRLIGNQVFQKSRGTGQREDEVHSRGGGGLGGVRTLHTSGRPGALSPFL